MTVFKDLLVERMKGCKRPEELVAMPD